MWRVTLIFYIDFADRLWIYILIYCESGIYNFKACDAFQTSYSPKVYIKVIMYKGFFILSLPKCLENVYI